MNKKTLTVLVSMNGSTKYISKHGGSIKEEYLSVHLNDLSMRYECDGCRLTEQGVVALESDLLKRMTEIAFVNKELV
jgi:hypothetical protein